MSDCVAIHIIYTEDEMVLSRKRYAGWREIQAEYQLYKASLGPWPPEAVIEYLISDYKNVSPDVAEQVQSFVRSGELTVALRFN